MPKKAATKPVKKPAAAAKPAAPAPKKTAVAKAPVKAAKPAAPVKAAKPAKAPKKSKPAKTGPKKGQGRVTSPSGPLSTAVVAILKRFKRPLSCREIGEALAKKGYVFTHPEPRRILSIRIYKLKGVKKVSAGRFTHSEA